MRVILFVENFKTAAAKGLINLFLLCVLEVKV